MTNLTDTAPKTVTVFDFMRYRRLLLTVSLIALIGSCSSLFINGLNLGIDFTGGTLIEVTYAQVRSPSAIREDLSGTEFSGAVVQSFGNPNDMLIRLSTQPAEDREKLGDRLLSHLQTGGHDVVMRRVEFVGPQVGEELTRAGAWALLYALLGIMVYVALRFQTRFSFSAIAALVHDVVLVLGFFSLTQFPFDLSVLAAILAVIGYSLNDTIVIFDRIRENFRLMHKADPTTIINTSLSHTLGRTLVTSLTTLMVLITLAVFGGEIIRPFSIALTFGVVVGTYSSLWVASPILLLLRISKKDLQQQSPRSDGDDETKGIVT